MSRADRLFLACCTGIALHTGSSADREFRRNLAILGEVLPDVRRPGPGSEVSGLTLRHVAQGLVKVGPPGMDDARAMLRLLLAEHARGEAQDAYDAWRANPVG